MLAAMMQHLGGAGSTTRKKEHLSWIAPFA